MDFILLSIETIAIVLTIRFMISQYKNIRHKIVNESKICSIKSDSYFSNLTSTSLYQDYYNSILENNTVRINSSNNNFDYSDYANQLTSTFVRNRIKTTNITPRMNIVQIISIKAA